jgi:2-phosphoglycerate kinase
VRAWRAASIWVGGLDDEQLRSPLVAVTGGTGGVGRATVREFAGRSRTTISAVIET